LVFPFFGDDGLVKYLSRYIWLLNNIVYKACRGVFKVTAQYYFVFSSKSQAIYMEAKLREKGYCPELRPTPGKLGKACSYSLVIPGDLISIKHVRDQVLGYKMSLKGVFRASKTGRSVTFTKVF
jgi:hypothetical protein